MTAAAHPQLRFAYRPLAELAELASEHANVRGHSPKQLVGFVILAGHARRAVALAIALVEIPTASVKATTND